MNKIAKITTKEELYEWIVAHNNFNGYLSENELYITAPYNSSTLINIEENDSFQDVLLKVIKDFEEFSADHEFNELWNEWFGQRENLTPSEFLRMLMSDEESLHELAKELRQLLIKI